MESADALSHIGVHTPIQVPATRCSEEAATDSSVYKVTNWNLYPAAPQSLFNGFHTADASFVAAQTTPDYDKKVLEWQECASSTDWVPPTPQPLSSNTSPSEQTHWDAPHGIPRPQPTKRDTGVEVEMDVEVEKEDDGNRSSESPIDVISTSAFAPPEKKEEELNDGPALPCVVRPTPLIPIPRRDAPPVLLDQATLLSSPQKLVESEDGSPSNANTSHGSASFVRAPGLGPAPQTPTTSNGNNYVCPICGFSCPSKFHYNSHMNTHGDHQCNMCDYTSRTEGRLKKHMRESHTVEERAAAGLEVSPPPSAHPALPSSSSENSPVKPCALPMDSQESQCATPLDVSTVSLQEPSSTDSSMPSPTTLSSALMGIIATTSASSTSALDQMRLITEGPLLREGSPSLHMLPSAPSSVKKEGGERRGKSKQYKCKQCPHVSPTKEEQWEHARTHIPSDKQLSCPKCNFVTEYKHHLEYHIRNHLGSKPFQCKKCAYTCVNKSMLNSHMKSHTNIYQFRCADCTYATKYCHSLKLHLKKYSHRRKMEGVDGEIIICDANSPPTMRKDSSTSIASSLSGPFTPFSMKKEEPSTPTGVLTAASPFSLALPSIANSQRLNYATQMLLQQHRMEQMLGMGALSIPTIKCNMSMCDFSCRTTDELMQHNVDHLRMLGGVYGLDLQRGLSIPERTGEDDDTTGSPPGDDAVSHSNGSSASPVGSARSADDTDSSSRRKSKASIDDIGTRLREKASPDTVDKQEPMDAEEEESSATATATLLDGRPLILPSTSLADIPSALTSLPSFNNLSPLQQAYLAHIASQAEKQQNGDWKYECSHCRMGFMDEALHQIHMGYHGYQDVFQCNRCGQPTGSALAFNLHLLQSSHL